MLEGPPVAPSLLRRLLNPLCLDQHSRPRRRKPTHWVPFPEPERRRTKEVDNSPSAATSGHRRRASHFLTSVDRVPPRVVVERP